MITIDSVVKALIDDKGFNDVKNIDLLEKDILDPDIYQFVGVRSYWGSATSCALISLSDEDHTTVTKAAENYYSFTKSLRNYAARLGLTKLGAFGLLCFFSTFPCSDEFRDHIIKLKSGSARNTDYCLCWLLDAGRARIHCHKGFPLATFPGKKFFTGLLKANRD
jgi:hypothetical protein